MPSFTLTNEENYLRIATNKSLCKEYTTNEYRKVYLKNGTEFQLQLFNPTTDAISAEIYLNNKRLNNELILRPGERVWLDRYLDKPQKFLFSTYEVDSNNDAVKKAIANNGIVEVRFYRESTLKYYDNNWISTYTPSFNVQGSSTCNYVSSTLDTNITSNYTTTTSCGPQNATLCCARTSSTPSTKETGRIEEGSHSNQKFSSSNKVFDTWSFHREMIQILPLSEKPTYSEDLKKRYCPFCGAKIKEKFKFCPHCGKEI